MKGIILLTSGFEDTEAITTIDILRRAGLEIDLVACSNESEIHTQTGLYIKPEKMIQNVDYKSYDFLIIPGGKAVSKTLIKLDIVDEIVKNFYESHKLIAAICAAPMILGKNGILKGKKFTCFPSCEEGIDGKYTKAGVVETENIITGKSMAYTIDFALAIVNYLLGKDKMKAVQNSIFGK